MVNSQESQEESLQVHQPRFEATPRWSLTSLVSASASSFITRGSKKVINICLSHLTLNNSEVKLLHLFFKFFPYSVCYILQFYHLSVSSLIINKYRYTLDILADWVPDNLNKVNISIKQVIQIVCFPVCIKVIFILYCSQHCV